MLSNIKYFCPIAGSTLPSESGTIDSSQKTPGNSAEIRHDLFDFFPHCAIITPLLLRNCLAFRDFPFPRRVCIAAFDNYLRRSYIKNFWVS